MLKLKKLSFSGIGRFVKEQTVQVDELGNLVQVDGENRNTGGSSGSGKTTVFNALDYLLGLNDLPTTVLQSRLTKEKMSVEGEFDWNGKHVIIARSAKLSITIDGQLTVGSSALTEEKLDEILGMPRDLFRKILHKRQKEGGFFLEFTPKKMYEFLTDALNLASERKKLEKVEAKLSELEKSKTAKESKINELRASVKAMQESILSLGLPPVRDIHQSVILELKAKADASQAKFMSVTADHKAQNEALDLERPALIPNPELEPVPQLEQPALLDTVLDNKLTIEILEVDIRNLNKEIADLKEVENIRIRELNDKIQSHKMTIQALGHKCTLSNTAKTEAVKVAGEIKKIRDAICPTCEQSWVTPTAKVKETEYLATLAKHKTAIQEGANAEVVISELNKEIELLTQQLAPQQNDAILAKNNEILSKNAQIQEEKTKAVAFKAEITAKNVEMMTKYKQDQAAASSEITARNAALLAEVSSKNKAAQDQYQFRVQAVREIQAREMDQARGQADVDRRALEAAVAKLTAFTEASKRYETSLSYMKTNEAAYVKDLSEKEADLAALLVEIAKAEALKKAVKLFISISFDDALEAIGDAATKIIRCIPTMSSATIQFEGQKETKDGKVKEEVNAVISMDGDIGIPIKSLSGGERSSVDLAVDLAVIDFIENESAKGIDVFILDEPFTGLDTVSIEMALEVLKNSNSTKKLIVVDHNPEVKQMVSNRLVVVRDGDSSTISSQEV